MEPAARAAIRISRIAAGTGLAVLAAIPWAWIDHAPVVCLFRRLLGRPCPGCGITHSVWLLLHGHPAAAFHWNPLGFLLLPALLAFVLLGWPVRLKVGQVDGLPSAGRRPAPL